MIYVIFLMSVFDFIKNSLLVVDSGWVEVNKEIIQYVCYFNVFFFGDCSNLFIFKMGVVICKQVLIIVVNILVFMVGVELLKVYDGYILCLLVIGYGSLILVEFDYNKEFMESFLFNQVEECYSMYVFKVYVLFKMYWYGMFCGCEF